MATSEARRLASQANGKRSKGPSTPEGKRISRSNSLKHGLTGAGIVLAEQDLSEVEQRNTDLLDQFDPKSPMGKILVRRMATLSVRMERSEKQETAAVASRVRNAPSDFDDARYQRAEDLLDGLGENPCGNLRRLLKMPEGVELMIQAWNDLRSDLKREGKPLWTAAHLVKAANLLGVRDEHARISPIGQLSKGVWGDFGGAIDDESQDVELEILKAQAVAKLLERIDAEIADLEAHYKTLDFETIDLDRAQAPDIALFDPSREATLARRYESEASRGFFKALKELRQVEAEAVARPEPAATPDPEANCAPLGSFGDRPSPAVREPRPEPVPLRPVDDQPVHGPGGRLDPVVRPPLASA